MSVKFNPNLEPTPALTFATVAAVNYIKSVANGDEFPDGVRLFITDVTDSYISTMSEIFDKPNTLIAYSYQVVDVNKLPTKSVLVALPQYVLNLFFAHIYTQHKKYEKELGHTQIYDAFLAKMYQSEKHKITGEPLYSEFFDKYGINACVQHQSLMPVMNEKAFTQDVINNLKLGVIKHSNSLISRAVELVNHKFSDEYIADFNSTN